MESWSNAVRCTERRRARASLSAERATVVFVDANPAVLELAEQALRDAGHRVLVTTQVLEALSVALTVRVDLVVGDSVTLKSFSGYPDVPQFLEVDDNAMEMSVRPTLRKPFTLAQLRDAVALALGTIEP
jgi:DNA-binding NtrC family response regulator